MNTFAELFKYYRLRSGIASLTEFADAFANKGYFYELSIFSHWQKGTRTPTKREVVLTVVEVFIEHDGIVSANQSNELLESAGHGYLTDRERERFFTSKIPTPSVSATVL